MAFTQENNMGCDGGTIPRRDELVRLKKKPEQKDKESELSFRWRHCSITQQPLREPIVACGHGRLYCKESILEGLLDRSKLPEQAAHITSMKDVKELVLTPNPAYARAKGGEKGESGHYVDHRTSPYVCPVIGMELSGKFRFAFSWTCGCVVSEKAIKEVPTKFCHKCQHPFDENDLVYINAEGDLLELMRSRMEARKLHAKANKKNKKNKQLTCTVTSVTAEETKKPELAQNVHYFVDDEKPSCSKSVPVFETEIVETSIVKQEPAEEIAPKSPEVLGKEETSTNMVQKTANELEESKIRPSTSSEEKKESKKELRSHSSDSKRHRDHRTSHRKSSKDRSSNRNSGDHHKSHRSERDKKVSREHKSRDHKSKSVNLESISDPAYKKAKLDYSVANDPKATSVYKSLFTSHENAKSQTKAHWVTYNPFYN
ncbi:hypothetical protein B566_EDAN015936 [Ephemera danica]|nr:hypothetical protein B566_EDAN015936 [Ephemera danica]